MKSKLFPIVDVQFHREGLNELSDEHTEAERVVLSMWHSTAIECLHCGISWGLSSPAAFDEGRIVRPIEDVLVLFSDNRGQPYFLPIFKIEQ